MTDRACAGKAVLVTGGASGIGRAAALAFARAGARVPVSDVNAAGGEETVGLITQAGGEAIFVKADAVLRCSQRMRRASMRWSA